jgi:hypothetical protein
MAIEAHPQSLSLEEAIARYANEWVLMKVTAEDRYHAPSHGVVVAHHPKRGTLQRQILNEIATHGAAGRQYYLFQAYPRDGHGHHDPLDEQELDRIERVLIRDTSA